MAPLLGISWVEARGEGRDNKREKRVAREKPHGKPRFSLFHYVRPKGGNRFCKPAALVAWDGKPARAGERAIARETVRGLNMGIITIRNFDVAAAMGFLPSLLFTRGHLSSSPLPLYLSLSLSSFWATRIRLHKRLKREWSPESAISYTSY